MAPARDLLERWLAQAALGRSVADCVVVWDGRGGVRAGRAPAPLTVLYTNQGETADARLLDLCRSDYAARPESTWVVSSDHGIQTPARQLGFTVLGARTFYERWASARPRGACPPVGPRNRTTRNRGAPQGEAEEAKPAPTRAGIEELLREFADGLPDGEGRPRA